MPNKEKKIKDIEQLLSLTGPNFSILEEEIDINVQHAFVAHLEKLCKNKQKFQKLLKQAIENVNDLFDDAIDQEVKKTMLTVLATANDVSIYRAIENYTRLNTPIRDWAVIALQQSRMLIQSSLLDDEGIFISTGLGGQGHLLRYFCIFFNRTSGLLQPFQQNTIRNELVSALKQHNGIVEQIDFSDSYTTILLLLPIEVPLQPLFTNVVDECNQYGNFLHENMLITNVKKLTDAEIRPLLAQLHNKE